MDESRRNRSETLGNLLASLPELGAAVRIGTVTRALAEILPRAWRSEIAFVALKDRVVLLKAENPVLLQELAQNRPSLLAELNRRLDPPVQDLLLKLGPLHRHATPLPSCPDEEEELPALPEELPDPVRPLARAVARLARRRACASCPSCGAALPLQGPCTLCRQAEKAQERQLERLLLQQPWRSEQELLPECQISPSRRQALREDLIVRLGRSLIRLADPAGGRKALRHLREKILVWQTLRTGRPAWKPDAAELRRGLDADAARQIIERLWPSEEHEERK